MINILQIVNYYYPHIGGIEETARCIAKSLIDDPKINMKIICFNENASKKNIINKRDENSIQTIDGVEVTRCKSEAKIFSQSLSLSYYKQLKNMFYNFKPDVVIFHYPNPFVAHFLLKIIPTNTKLILYWHLDITRQKFLRVFFHKQTLKLLKRSNKIIATSPNYIENSVYLSKFKYKCRVVPSCIDEEKLKIVDKKKEEEIKKEYKNKKICFAIGRHVKYKGLKYLIKASELLNDDYVVLIGGVGPLTNSLKYMARNDKKIKFLGRIKDEEISAYYQACDIFCFPSITKNEAFGLAIVEAMFFSKPTVTFTIPGSGVNYVTLDKITGIECPNKDVVSYYKAIRQLGEDKELYIKYSKNAKKRVEENFLFIDFKKNMEALINE